MIEVLDFPLSEEEKELLGLLRKLTNNVNSNFHFTIDGLKHLRKLAQERQNKCDKREARIVSKKVELNALQEESSVQVSAL